MGGTLNRPMEKGQFWLYPIFPMRRANRTQETQSFPKTETPLLTPKNSGFIQKTWEDDYIRIERIIKKHWIRNFTLFSHHF